uniref:ANK_REP_REGION domain-containing protein n=1 Tax=Globodera rostochiensis TaxID=31243 RepID=A0A914HKM6_GLORO
MCQLLVAHGIDQQDNKWMVCAACYGGHLDIVKHFFGTGIDSCGRLALAAASLHGRDDVLRHLLSEEKASAEQNSDKEEKASAEQNSDKEEKASAEQNSDKEEKASGEQNSDKEEKASAEQSLDKASTSSSSSSSKSRRESAADGESDSDVPSSSQNCGTRKTESEPQFADEMPQNTQQQVRAEKVFQCSGFVDAQRWRSNINADILNRLLNADAPQFNCANALIVGALNGHLNAVEILLENKVCYLRELFKMTIDEGTTMTSLWIATAAGHLEVARRLLVVTGTDPNKGAKLTIDGKVITDLSPLCIVTSESICELLIENGAQVDQQMGNGQTPLFCACIRGNLEIVKCLVENGADINAVDELGRTPLMAAAFHGHVGLVRDLLERGARIDLATNAGGSTARDFADQSENGEIAKMLREAERQRTTTA